MPETNCDWGIQWHQVATEAVLHDGADGFQGQLAIHHQGDMIPLYILSPVCPSVALCVLFSFAGFAAHVRRSCPSACVYLTCSQTIGNRERERENTKGHAPGKPRIQRGCDKEKKTKTYRNHTTEGAAEAFTLLFTPSARDRQAIENFGHRVSTNIHQALITITRSVAVSKYLSSAILPLPCRVAFYVTWLHLNNLNLSLMQLCLTAFCT